MTQRNVDVWESPYDLMKLDANGFSYCIAKSVIDSSGKPTFNMVWRSLNLSPRATISWTVQYGLNWTLNIPAGNAQVTVGGIWQPCNPGEVYDIDSIGLFKPSTVPAKANFLMVGKNGYKYGGSSGINIVVGVKSPGGDFDPIYVDTTALAPNMSSWYQPQESAQWWYEKGVQSGSMISGARGKICDYDLTPVNPVTNTYYVSSTYHYDTGEWSTSYLQPPSVASTGLMRSPDLLAESLQNSDLDRIRGNVADIMEFLEKLGYQNQVKAPGPEFYYGLVRFATVAYCTHGVKVIVKDLTDKGYGATIKIDKNGVEATIVVKPPPKLQATGFTAGVVPQKVVDDWNAAVKADAADNPTNEGISSSGNKSLTNGPNDDVDGTAENVN